MAKYIDVEIKFKKTIKVDNDDLQEALKIAEDEYPDLELTPEWLKARKIELKENMLIESCAEILAKRYYTNFNQRNLEEEIGLIFKDADIKDYVYDETISILKNKYHIADIDIKI